MIIPECYVKIKGIIFKEVHKFRYEYLPTLLLSVGVSERSKTEYIRQR